MALTRIIRKEQPDLIHGNYPLPFFPEIAAIIAKRYDIPFILTGHGAFEMDFRSAIGVFGAIYNRTALRVPLSIATQIHVSNTGIRDELSLYRKWRSKIDVIPMGVDLDWYDPSLCDSPPPFSIDDVHPVVLYAGSFRRYKELHLLIDAFDYLSLDARLVLIGDGPEYDALSKKVTQRGLGDQITFPGHVSDRTLRSAYKHADLFVLPSSSLEESLGLVALEAMAMGLPTIVTEASGVGRMMKEDEAGAVVPPNDAVALSEAIKHLLADEKEYKRQQRLGAAIIRDRFAWNQLVDSYINLYQNVLEKQ